jgi:hypothetical protein
MSKREAGNHFPRAARRAQPRKIFRKTRPDGREDFPAACQR